MRAIYKGTVVAESDDTVVVEGNHYFPREALVDEHFSPSSTSTVCPWKGTASYLNVDDNRDAAWFYAAPKDAAKEIKDRVAFWKGIVVTA